MLKDNEKWIVNDDVKRIKSKRKMRWSPAKQPKTKYSCLENCNYIKRMVGL